MTHEDRVKRFDAFVRLRKRGAPFQSIAELYGITHQAVQSFLKKGRPTRTNKPGPTTKLLASYGYYDIQGREYARMLVRVRDDFTCQDCGKRRAPMEINRANGKSSGLKGRMKHFDIHHIDGQCGKNSRGYDSVKDLSGMITLCHSCHFSRPEHTGKRNSYKSRGIVCSECEGPAQVRGLCLIHYHRHYRRRYRQKLAALSTPFI